MKRQRSDNAGKLSSSPTDPQFNDISTADVILTLHLEHDQIPPSSPSSSSSTLENAPSVELYLHSAVLRRCRFFSALLSDRWRHSEQEETTSHGKISRINMKVSIFSDKTRLPFETHVSVLKLLYSRDFSSINSVAGALEALFVALEILFDDCVKACVRFLEAVPWTEDEENLIVSVIPFLPMPECKELVSRILPFFNDERASSEEMLHGLVSSAIQAHPSMPAVKAFVARLLKEFPDRDSVGRVIDKAFLDNLETLKSLLAEYASPDFRTAGDNDESEAIQRLNLHAALVSTRKLLWVIERMIELRVGGNAVREWSEQSALAVDLQKAFKDEAWRNIAPGLPAYVMKCTSRLANAVASGSILSDRQVRMRLVKNWLPVLNVCRDVVSPMHSSQKLLQQELEETFLRIISTLPLSDSQFLLQQCLWFATRNADCPHLNSAFKTWFRRANRNQGEENGS